MIAREAMMEDLACVTELALALWPQHTREEMQEEMTRYISGRETAAFLVKAGEKDIGLALCSLRHDYVEGTETSPVGYLEGIYTDISFRGKGAARCLLSAVQNWAKGMGCSQFASDCELENSDSLAFHLACGFEEANRIICFVKTLE